MTGFSTPFRRRAKLPAIMAAVIVLVACGDDQGNGLSDGQPGLMLARGEQDVERPDIFDVSDRGLWDGRPSLGGIWVAHPDVREPERVVIRNAANGQFTVGALFRRERANPGPALQLSSDAAEALGILAGAPTDLTVVALRREEVTTAADPAIASAPDADVTALPAPVDVAATPLDATTTTDVVAVNLPPATATPAPTTSAAVSGGLPPTPLVQIGVFSMQSNADTAAARLQAAGFTANVIPLQSSGRQTWRVVAGPVPDPTALSRVQALGFTDAYILPNPS